MADQIDITNVKTMGQFKAAIEDFVRNNFSDMKNYFSDMMFGYHGKTVVVDDGGSKETTMHSVTINLSDFHFTKHYGTVDIVSVDSTLIQNESSIASQSQIFMWWDTDGNFNFIVPRNCMREYHSASVPLRLQYIDENSITFQKANNMLSFTIVNAPSSSKNETPGCKFKVDYHIW